MYLAAQGRRNNWQRVREGRISPAALDLASVEEDAAFVRTYQPNLVPGLLQIEEYARAIIETGLPSPTRDNDELVAFRMSRQGVLTRWKPPRSCFLIGESVLHQVVGSPEIMHAQLERLVNARDQID
jgi:hypothetical protein